MNINGLYIRAKSWGYQDSDLYTGNYEMTFTTWNDGTEEDYWLGDFKNDSSEETKFQIVPICEFGNALRLMRDRYGMTATDEEIEAVWDKWIDWHNSNHEFFIHKFSKKHREYFKDLTGGFREYFYFTREMVTNCTQKAVQIKHPIVGEQWIPKSQLFMYTENNADKRHHLSDMDGWLSPASDVLAKSGYEKYLQEKFRTLGRSEERFTSMDIGAYESNSKCQLRMWEHPFEIYVKRWTCNNFKHLELR